MAGPHLTAAEVADYIDRHSMSLAERARATEHLARCQECQAIVAGTVRSINAIVNSLLEKLEE